nr:hypothetical protein [Tanacetum cinerariifolium]
MKAFLLDILSAARHLEYLIVEPVLFRRLCINGVNAANSSVSTAGQNSIDSTNDFSAAGPSNAAM